MEIRPKLLKSVGHEVGGDRPDRKPEIALAVFRNKNTEWGKLLFGLKIMIRCFLLNAVFLAPGKGADINDGLAINRNPDCIGGIIGFFVDRIQWTEFPRPLHPVH